MRTTLAIIKPDVAGLKENDVLRHVLDRGFRILALRREQYAGSVWAEFYKEHAGREFFPKLVEFMASGPATPMVLEYTNDATVEAWRVAIGATDPRKAAPGTLRALYGDKTGEAIWRNVAHGSASSLEAAREEAFFFPELTQACATCLRVLRTDPTRHFKECERRAEFPTASTLPCSACGGSGRMRA